MRLVFSIPILKTENVVAKKDGSVYVAKRVEGRRTAHLLLDLDRNGRLRLDRASHTKGKLVEAISLGISELNKRGKTYRDIFRGRPSGIKLYILSEGEYIADVSDDGSVDFDPVSAEILGKGFPRSLPLIYTLVIDIVLSYLRSQSPQESLLAGLSHFEDLSKPEKELVLEALDGPDIDCGNIFHRFLSEGLGAPQAERERLAAWVQTRGMIDLPYDGNRVREEGTKFSGDLSGLRTAMLSVLSDTFDREVDSRNAERISDWCLENGRRFVVARFGRAFFTDGLLIANSRGIYSKDVTGVTRRLINEFNKAKFSLKFHELLAADGELKKIGSEVDRISNLLIHDWFPEAKISGTLDRLRSSLRQVESDLLSRVDSLYAENFSLIASERKLSDRSHTEEAIKSDESNIREKIAFLSDAIRDLEVAVSAAPKFKPVFVAFISRIHELDAINIARVNELLDPFFGENEEMIHLIAGAGDNMTITPNVDSWLMRAHDWVEALPAYAHYVIVPSDGGYRVSAFTQREVLEIIYKTCADAWAKNIEHVMALEHVDIARRLLFEGIDTGYRDEKDPIKLVRKKRWENYVGAVAELVEKAYYDNTGPVAARQSELIENSRYMALLGFLRENPDTLGPEFERLVSCAREGKPPAKELSGEKAVFYSKLACTNKRNLPNVHVLTTLGPTETESNIAPWLEESMALFNIIRHYRLEDKVNDKVSRYRGQIGAVALKVIDEEELEGELLRVMAENGLDERNMKERSRGAMILLGLYPEVAHEVAKLAILIEEQKGFSLSLRDLVGEPNSVSEIMEGNPELEAEVVKKAIFDNGMQTEAEKLAESEGIPWEKAALRLAEERLKKEKDSLLHSKAREIALKRLGITGRKTANYIRDHAGPLAAFTARREVIAESGLSDKLNDGRFRYESDGPYKKYNLMYTPSRVDLGPEIIKSVKTVPKWVGGSGPEAANAGESLYSLFNTAGVTALKRPQLAEFLKVGENFFTRGGVYYLSLTAGANIDTLGIGDFEVFQSEWNRRGDRMVLPTGETYGGFCVPKEFSLLFAIVTRALNPDTRDEIFDAFGIPEEKEFRNKLVDNLRHILRLRRKCSSSYEWEEKALAYLRTNSGNYFDILDRENAYIGRLPQLALSLEKVGVISSGDEAEKRADYLIANWKNKKALGMEEINRSGVFDKVRLIRSLIAESRRKNPKVTPPEKLTGVMAAGYKEDVTDVRFSAGARKLEIYSGTALEHLLEDLDPEGRELYRDLFMDLPTVADIRMVGTCTAKDLFGHVPMNFRKYAESGRNLLKDIGADDVWIDGNISVHGVEIDGWSWDDLGKISPGKLRQVKKELRTKALFMAFGDNLAQIADGVRRRLMDLSELTDRMIVANSKAYGGDLSRWEGIVELPQEKREKIIKSIGPAIHILVIESRDVFSKERYETAVTGVDFIDLGIPDGEMLDLVDNLPKLLHLMKKERPDSALVFADGTSGARRRTFSFRYPDASEKAKELFALDDRAVYGCMGLGRETIEEWRREMERDREDARKLLSALLEHRFDDARSAYEEIKARFRLERKVENALNIESRARGLGLWNMNYRYMSELLGRLEGDLPLEELDFGTFLAIGGKYILNGKVSPEELQDVKGDFEHAIGLLPGEKKMFLPVESVKIDSLIGFLIRPEYVPPKKPFREVSTGVAGSLKATEELTLKLETRELRRRQAERALRIKERRDAFRREFDEARELLEKSEFRSVFLRAKETISDPESDINEENFGKYLAYVRSAFVILTDAIFEEADPLKVELIREINSVFRGGEILDSEYLVLAHRIGRFFERVSDRDDRVSDVAGLAELLDISLLIQKSMDIYSEHDAWMALASFFDQTVNNHIFDYIPYHYHSERTSAFSDLEKWPRERIFDMARERHLWLYRFARYITETKTEVKDRPGNYRDLWLGKVNSSGDVTEPAIGVNVEDESQKFWFSYARLRDTATLIHDGYPLPEIFDRLSPETVKVSERKNVAIIYPVGNTTVAVALEQNHRLVSEDEVNLFLCPFPEIIWNGERANLRITDALFFITPEDYKKLTDKDSSDGRGVLAMARFTEAVPVEAIWFHFTHFLRPYIEDTGIPLVQPLLWEAATYLKCALPDMVRGSGVSAPDQVNWYQEETDKLGREGSMGAVEARLRPIAEGHSALIVKAEKESGGRRSEILPVRDEEDRFLEDNFSRLVETAYDISLTDNVVVQEVIQSRVRQLYSEEFLEKFSRRFIRELGIGIEFDSPLFSYLRLIVMMRPDGSYEVTHKITVLSTAGIANVGRGGRLFEYRDEKINPKYRDDLREEIYFAALSTLRSQEEFIKENRQRIIDSYLQVHREFAGEKTRMLIPKRNVLGVPDWRIIYEMGDYMPAFLVDEKDSLVRIYDRGEGRFIDLFKDGEPSRELDIYDEEGKAVELLDRKGRPVAVPLFDSDGNRRNLTYRLAHEDPDVRHPVRSLTVLKIEPNPGAGLWRPHNDRLKLVGRDGEGVYKIFKILGEWAGEYKKLSMRET